jgi:hypothetical protein
MTPLEAEIEARRFGTKTALPALSRAFLGRTDAIRTRLGRLPSSHTGVDDRDDGPAAVEPLVHRANRAFQTAVSCRADRASKRLSRSKRASGEKRD